MSRESDLTPQILDVDLSVPIRIHIIGIGGAGMRGIARVLLDMGHVVTGSDARHSPDLDRLSELGIHLWVGHSDGSFSALGAVDLVARSTAVPDTNQEVVAALRAGLRVSSRAEVLAAISRSRPSVLVAGTHGKTTTSSMLAVTLEGLGERPGFVIGADVVNFGNGGRWVEDGSLVIEADESDGTFLALAAGHAVITSLEPDHHDFYGSQANLRASFERFVSSVKGHVVICVDDVGASGLAKGTSAITYGFHPSADLRLSDLEVSRLMARFSVVWKTGSLGVIEVGLPGRHNALNAAAVVAMCLALGYDFESIRLALESFRGVRRRFEFRGRSREVDFVDDYAHLPAEVTAAVATGLAGRWARVVCVHQPHRYTRTERLAPDFATAFAFVDVLVLTELYSSGEEPLPGVSGRLIYDSVRSACPWLDVRWCPHLDDVVELLVDVLREGDLCLTLGAGDVTTVPGRVLESFGDKSAAVSGKAGARLSNPRSSTVAQGSIAGFLREELAVSTVTDSYPLGQRTTYGVGGGCRALVETNSVADLARVARLADDESLPLLFVGRGSNMLVADEGFEGLAVLLGESFASLAFKGNELVVGAATAMPVAARKTVAAGLAGFEWAVGIPGSVGGGVAMNAGGHGSDMQSVLQEATVLAVDDLEVMTLAARQLQFGYRSSSVSNRHCVLSVRLKLSYDVPGDGELKLSRIVTWRREKQPGGHNAGSVFVNPVGDSAGRLIEQAGCKGLRVGSAQVSGKHANFVQVEPGGCASDVFELMRLMAQRVFEHSGITLEPETRLVGFPQWNRPTERL